MRIAGGDGHEGVDGGAAVVDFDLRSSVCDGVGAELSAGTISPTIKGVIFSNGAGVFIARSNMIPDVIVIKKKGGIVR